MAIPQAQNRSSFLRNAFKEIIAEFYSKNVPFLAAAISFNAFLVTFPFLMLFLSVIGIVGSYLPYLGLNVEVFLVSILGKYGRQVYNFAESIIHKRFGYGIFGFSALLITFSFVLSPVETALKIIYEEKKSRSFLVQRLLGIAFFLLIVFIFLFFAMLVFFLQVLIAFLQRTELPLAGNLRFERAFLASKIFMPLVFLFSVFVISYIFYRYLTVRKPNSKLSAVASLFTALTVEIGRQLYLIYLSRFPFYDLIYGAFGFVFVTMALIYYFATVFLIGAVILKVMQKHSILV